MYIHEYDKETGGFLPPRKMKLRELAVEKVCSFIRVLSYLKGPLYGAKPDSKGDCKFKKLTLIERVKFVLGLNGSPMFISQLDIGTAVILEPNFSEWEPEYENRN